MAENVKNVKRENVHGSLSKSRSMPNWFKRPEKTVGCKKKNKQKNIEYSFFVDILDRMILIHRHPKIEPRVRDLELEFVQE
jgi:hypothetical protein